MSKKRNLALAKQRRIGKLVEQRNKALAEMRRLVAAQPVPIYCLPEGWGELRDGFDLRELDRGTVQ